MMADFNPEKYADERRKKIMDLLKQKAKEKAPGGGACGRGRRGSRSARSDRRSGGEHAQNEEGMRK